MSERLLQLEERYEADPSSRVFLQLAEEYRRLGRASDALAILDGGLEHHPNWLAASVARGRCLLELQQLEGAIETLEAVVERDPTQLVAYLHLIEAHFEAGSYDRARELLGLYRDLQPDDPRIEDLEQRLGGSASVDGSVSHPDASHAADGGDEVDPGVEQPLTAVGSEEPTLSIPVPPLAVASPAAEPSLLSDSEGTPSATPVEAPEQDEDAVVYTLGEEAEEPGVAAPEVAAERTLFRLDLGLDTAPPELLGSLRAGPPRPLESMRASDSERPRADDGRSVDAAAALEPALEGNEHTAAATESAQGPTEEFDGSSSSEESDPRSPELDMASFDRVASPIEAQPLGSVSLSELVPSSDVENASGLDSASGPEPIAASPEKAMPERAMAEDVEAVGHQQVSQPLAPEAPEVSAAPTPTTPPPEIPPAPVAEPPPVTQYPAPPSSDSLDDTASAVSEEAPTTASDNVPGGELATGVAGEVSGEAHVEPSADGAVTDPATLTLARLYRDQGHANDAARVLENVLATDPDNEDARRDLGAVNDPSQEMPAKEVSAQTLLAGYDATPPGGLSEKKSYVLRAYLDRLRGSGEASTTAPSAPGVDAGAEP